jgi:uncharacterized protein YjbI with pentapeptide repeats
MKFEESDENDDKHIDLSYTNLYHADFVGLHFEKTIFAESILTSRKYYNTYFNKANFYLADFKNSVLKYSHFEESNLNQTNLENTDSFMNYYNKAELTEANFKNSKIKKSFFQDNYFDYTNFTVSTISNCTFIDVFFDNIIINKSRIEYSNLKEAFGLTIDLLDKVKTLKNSKLPDYILDHEDFYKISHLLHK